MCLPQSETLKCQWINESNLANFVNEIHNWAILVEVFLGRHATSMRRGDEHYSCNLLEKT